MQVGVVLFKGYLLHVPLTEIPKFTNLLKSTISSQSANCLLAYVIDLASMVSAINFTTESLIHIENKNNLFGFERLQVTIQAG